MLFAAIFFEWFPQLKNLGDYTLPVEMTGIDFARNHQACCQKCGSMTKLSTGWGKIVGIVNPTPVLMTAC